MLRTSTLYIDGRWVEPASPELIDIINPATEDVCARVALGGPADVDYAVAAAKKAFREFSVTSREERVDLLCRVLECYTQRLDDIGDAMMLEMGAPRSFARHIQAGVGVAHLTKMVETLRAFSFEEQREGFWLHREPIGVAGLITPWNWPINQIVCKVAPALAAGCAIVLKPSELAPLSAMIFAEVMHAAGVPRGVFNMVQGRGDDVGQALSVHPDVDVVSFTGSTRAGIAVAKNGADSIKRITQELGGKSANIVLPDADLEVAIRQGVRRCFSNSGQSCNAPTRMLVPADRYDVAAQIGRRCAEALVVGDPTEPSTQLGPLSNARQYDKVQELICSGIEEGAELIAGGPGRPEAFKRGYYTRPTIFGRVMPNMRIAREEIFGPVLSIFTYRNEEEAIRIANDSVYGLAAYIQTSDRGAAQSLAKRLRVGSVYVNDPEWDPGVPFGGYRQSGNGREYAEFGLLEFLELKAIAGLASAVEK